MKLQIIKQEVFSLTCTSNTKQLKQERPDLASGKDLRYKKHWLEILQKLKTLRFHNQEISIADIEESEQMLKQSLIAVGHLAGLTDEQIEVDWQRIKLEAQFEDIHIEDL
ncbi:MAG: hypothetical protein HC895_09365 [Leptolyngbyaceae cyanobacterium SM1_3_5]|nr:hypothetical protein [Leptolyngbyaceae cyanobacterium SM1_3_5]